MKIFNIFSSLKKDEISITENGKIYKGIRTIHGRRKLFQSISYNNTKKSDPRQYKRNEIGYMDTMAKQILWEIVKLDIPL